MTASTRNSITCIAKSKCCTTARNPYIEAIRNNIEHLVRILSTGNWSLLRRKPPYFLGIGTAATDMESLVSSHLASFTGRAIESENGLLMPV